MNRKLIRSRMAKLQSPLLCLLTNNLQPTAKLFVGLFAFLCTAGTSFSQSSQMTEPKSTVNWSQGLSWSQILKKAKKENKYIFVDCYATWCKPCKLMDKNVYSVDSVGDYLNANFISVKLQMDQTENDDAATKSWYKTARSFEKDYNIGAYPTLLFFKPNGEIATKQVGCGNGSPGGFLTTSRDAKDPSKQYYVLLKNYKNGKLDDASKRSLIKTAHDLGDTANYRALRKSYFAYLHALPNDKLYTKENIEFVAGIISSGSQPMFDMFYPDGATVNNVMQKYDYAENVVEQVIYKEKVAAFFSAAVEAKQEPDWSNIYASIAKDYNNYYAARNVLGGKVYWYGYLQPDGLKYARSLNDKIEKYGSDTTDLGEDFKLNTAAYLIWQSLGNSPTAEISSDIMIELNRICKWMGGVARRGQKGDADYIGYWNMYIDTYANLLHKVGRTEEAIKWEEFAIKTLKETVKDETTVKDFTKGYGKQLDKMRKGIPTWPVAKK